MDTLINFDSIVAYSYSDYQDMIDRLMVQKKTTGKNHSEAYLHHTEMNVRRMKRLNKTLKLSEEMLAAIAQQPEQEWIVLTEAWCGDAAQNLPYLHSMAEASNDISLKLILRDEHLEIMDQFLTNGGRSIPKLIALDAEKNILFSWGPRPKKMQEVYNNLKGEGLPYEDISLKIHTMYSKDKGVELQKEIIELLNQTSN